MNSVKLKQGDCYVFTLYFNIYQEGDATEKLQSQPTAWNNFLKYWWSSIHASN